MGYRLIDSADSFVSIEVDGKSLRVPRRRSLLAGLLTAGVPVEFFCAIGQCQRCVVRVNGRQEVACQVFPSEDDVIEVRRETR